jgi:CBS domain-containing protein
MRIPTDVDEDRPVEGGEAPVRVYTADVVAVVPGDASVLGAAKELVADEVGLLVVGTEDRIEGVVSERDIVRALARGVDLASTPVRDIATNKVVCGDASATVTEVAELMMQQYIRHVLVEEDGVLIGVVSARDLLSAYVLGTATGEEQSP